MKKMALFVSCLLVSGMSQSVLAHSKKHYDDGDDDKPTLRPIITLSLGASIAQDSNPDSFSTSGPGFVTQYHTQAQNYPVGPVFGGFLGAEYAPSENFAWQFGLGVYQTFITLKGTQTQGDGSAGDNLWAYSYDTSSTQVLFDNKFLVTFAEFVHPYLSAGVGAAFNRASNYKAVSENPPPMGFPAIFANNSNTSFTYVVGAGFDFDITKHMVIGIGYRFASLGPINLGNGTVTKLMGDTIMTPALKTQTSYRHEILGQFSYKF